MENKQTSEQNRVEGFSTELPSAEYPKGVNYCLLIAINEYEHLEELRNPVPDIAKFKEIIEKKYSPKDLNQSKGKWDFRVLQNEDATRKNIKGELRKLKREITQEDNLLLFFAGHGLRSEEEDASEYQTYFAPCDAILENDGTYLRWDNLIKDYFLHFELNCFHFLIIVDACFGGALHSLMADITKPDNIGRIILKKGRDSRKYDLPSRYLLTSGRSELVPEGQAGKHSPFVIALIKHLNEFTQFELSLSHLFELMASFISTNYPSAPSPLLRPFGKNSQGGQFVFQRPLIHPLTDQEIRLRDAFFEIDFKYQKDDFCSMYHPKDDKISMVVLNGDQKDGVHVLTKALISTRIREFDFNYKLEYAELRGEQEDELWQILRQKVCIKQSQTRFVGLDRKELVQGVVEALIERPLILLLNVPKEEEEEDGVPLKSVVETINKFRASLQQEIFDPEHHIEKSLLFFIINRWGFYPLDQDAKLENTEEVVFKCRKLILEPLEKRSARDLRIWWREQEWGKRLKKEMFPSFFNIQFESFSEEECHIGNAIERICKEIDNEDFYHRLVELEDIIV